MGFNMPYQKERENDEKKSAVSKKFYKPLPNGAGTSVSNDVIIPLFSPNTWAMFNPTPEQAARYGFAGGGGLVSLSASDPLETFYFRLLTHSIDKFSRPDGSVGYAQVICPIEMNKYLVGIGKNPMFEAPRCAFCEEEAKSWESHNEHWESLGVDKKKLSKEGYRDFINSHSALASSRDQARKFQADARFVVSVFDHAKAIGQRPRDEGESAIEHQIWFAPKAIFDGLCAIYDAGAAFFSPGPQGFPIVSITKNTQDCKAGDMRNTKYSVNFVGKHHAYDPQWTAYLLNKQAMVDPTEFVHFVSYEEGLFYVANMRESAHAPAQPTQAQVPQGYAAPAPQGYVPQAPQGYAPQAPQGYTPPPPQMPQGAPQPPQGYPSAPQPPQMPQGVPPVPSAPQMPQGVPQAPPGYVPQAPQMPQGMPPGTPPTAMPPGGMIPQGMPPMGAPPSAMPPGAMPPAAGAPAGAPPGPPIPMQAPVAPPASSPVPVIGQVQGGGQPPAPPTDRTPPGGDPVRRRSW